MHLVEGKRKLYTIVSNTFMDLCSFFERARIGSLSVFGPSDALVGRSAYLSETCEPLDQLTR